MSKENKRELFGISVWVYDLVYFIIGIVKILLIDSYLVRNNLFLNRFLIILFFVWIVHNGLITIKEKKTDIRTTGKAIGEGAIMIGIIMLIISLAALIII
ncbi:MAG: hypothetical protein AABX77_00755 [Nanoarchaeota archaeon]